MVGHVITPDGGDYDRTRTVVAGHIDGWPAGVPADR
jgi:hypothetical protein